MLEVWPKQTFFDHLCDWVCYDLYYLDHEWWLLAQLDPSRVHPGLSFPFLELKNEPCKIIKRHYKIQGFGLGRVQGGAKTWSKSCLCFTLKISQTLCKTQGFRHPPPLKKQVPKHVSFYFVNKNRVFIIHGFATVKLMFWCVLMNGFSCIFESFF